MYGEQQSPGAPGPEADDHCPLCGGRLRDLGEWRRCIRPGCGWESWEDDKEEEESK